jgi:hypothetical protein
MKIFFCTKRSALLLAIVSFGVLFSSCKKSSSSNDSGYFVQANANGTLVKYTGYAAAISTTLSGTYVLDIQGQESLSSSTDILAAVIMDESPITTKTYTDEIVNGSPQGIVNYYDHTGKQFSSALATTPAVTITITSITSTSVSGTFSGTAVDINSGETIALTNGSFKVKKQ